MKVTLRLVGEEFLSSSNNEAERKAQIEGLGPEGCAVTGLEGSETVIHQQGSTLLRM